MINQQIPLDEIDWGALYARLYAYTDRYLRTLDWFRGNDTSSFLKGNEVHDYVSEAIKKFLENPEKYDTTKDRSIFNYIRLHILRNLVGNDVRSPENRNSIDSNKPEYNINNEDGEDSEYFETILFGYTEAYFDIQLDYDKIMSSIEKEINGDDILEKIFLGVCYNNYKRREVIEDFNLTDDEFDNGMRRLKTILKNTAIKFNLKKLSV